jgi:hypothetical protein
MKKVIGSFVLAMTTWAGSTVAATVNPVIEGKEWYQPNDIRGESWDAIALICPTNGIACAGQLGLIDVTGWIWASAEEVGDMFSSISPHPGGVGQYQERDSSWGSTFFTLFDDTQPGLATHNVISGYTSSLSAPDTAIKGTIILRHGYNQFDSVSTVSSAYTDDRYGPQAAWLYRPSEVPLPATAWLFGSALFGLVGVAKNRKVQRSPANSQ